MKRLIIISFVLFVYSIDLLGQIDPLGDIFLKPLPIWSHVAIDSTAIGYKGRTGMDYFLYLAERKILIDGVYAYLVYDNLFEKQSGSFLEKIDLKTGKSVWRNYFDLRNSVKREYTNHFFINDQSELELLTFQYPYDTVDIFTVNWDGGKMTIRKYDIETGEELYVYHSPLNDSSFPTFKTQRNVFSYLNKNVNGGYDCYTNWIDTRVISYSMAKTRMDTIGKFIEIEATNTIYSKYLKLNAYEEIPVLLNQKFDTIVRMIHTFKNKPFITGDTMELSLYLFNSKLEQIAHYDVSEYISKLREYSVINLKNNHICILGIEYFQDTTYPREHIFVFDSQGNLSEEVVYPARINDTLGRCLGAIKLKNEPGILIINKNLNSSVNNKFLFYKTDGKGNMELLSQHIMKDYYNISIEGYLEELDNGNILLSGLFRKTNTSNYPPTEKFITTLWDLKNITSTNNSNKNILSISIVPNPTESKFKILGLKTKPVEINLFDMTGKCVKRNKMAEFVEIETSLDISELTTGIYLLEILGDDNQLIYIGKVIKH